MMTALIKKNVVAMAVAVLTVSGAAPAAHAAESGRPELRRAIETIAESGFTGVQVRVHDERGEWAGSSGAPVNGRFRAGSVTKTFTATMVLQLVAEGRIGLDDPVARHLPRLGLDRRITVRMLLQHTSGLFNYTGEYLPDGTVVPGIPTAGKTWVDNRFHTYRPVELARFALARPARFEPGTAWSYANTNYTVALLLIERVTGHSYAEELRRRIVRPLGLTGTVAPGTSPEIPGPHAHAYYRYDTTTVDVTRQNPSWVPGAGDLISTTRDLDTFITALLRGRLIPQPLLAEMREPYPVYNYGLGLFVQNEGCAGTLVNHGGHVQGYATLMYSTPDGSKTLLASLTFVEDEALTVGAAYQEALKLLIETEFCR